MARARLRMKDDTLPKILLFGQSSRAKQKAGCPRFGWEDVIKKDFKEMRTFRECKVGGFEKIGMKEERA